jgi:tetratricopeptide (TPR) repeat protein
MISIRRASIVLLAAGLTAAVVPAFPQAPKSRAEALANLKSPDTATRAEAVTWIANRGTIADTPLLQERLRDESPFVRNFAESGLWLLWGRSGDAGIDAQMAHGTDLMQQGRHAESIEVFSSIIKARPEFAEGWNRRATVKYLAGDMRGSIADCTETLKRNPGHFGALSGLGQIHLALDQPEQALAWFRRALEANPNLLSAEFSIRQIEEAVKQKRRQRT